MTRDEVIYDLLGLLATVPSEDAYVRDGISALVKSIRIMEIRRMLNIAQDGSEDAKFFDDYKTMVDNLAATSKQICDDLWAMQAADQEKNADVSAGSQS